MNPDDRIQLIEQYLDGQLTGENLASFEARLRAEPELSAQVQQQREINDALRRQFAEPSGEFVQKMLADIKSGRTVDSPQVAGVIKPAAKSPSIPRWVAAAALIAIVFAGLWAAWMNMQGGSGGGVNAMLLDPVAYYKRAVETGFRPPWKCETDHEFATFFVDRYGQPVLLKTMPPDTSCAGIDYTTVLSSNTAALLIHEGDSHVVVLLDNATNDRELDMPKSSGLQKFRRDIGQYVAYEITPLGAPHILDLLYIPDRVPDMPPGAQTRPAEDAAAPSNESG